MDISRNFTLSAVATAGVVAVGFALQLAAGPFDSRVLVWPASGLLFGALVLLCVPVALSPRGRFVRWLSGVPLAVCLIAALGALVLIMGLTPQGARPVGAMAEAGAWLGFAAMTRSWPFVLTWLAVLVALGAVVARRLATFRFGKDWAFCLSHIGLWLTMAAGGLGHADMRQYMVRVDEGAATSQGVDATGHPVLLPIGLRLNDFTMESYPASDPHARPEPRRFASDVEVALPDGRMVRGVTEVNHPLKAGGWRVYQSGYDTAAGAASTYSVFEVVRDPWLGAVYAGFAMIAAGALAMIWRGRRRDGLE